VYSCPESNFLRKARRIEFEAHLHAPFREGRVDLGGILGEEAAIFLVEGLWLVASLK